MLEDTLPTGHHWTPATEQWPAWVDTLDMAGTEPDLFHLLEIKSLERTIESCIRCGDGGDFIHSGPPRGYGFGAINTRTVSRSGPGFRTACSSPAGARTAVP